MLLRLLPYYIGCGRIGVVRLVFIFLRESVPLKSIEKERFDVQINILSSLKFFSLIPRRNIE